MSQEEISEGLDFTATRQEKDLVIDLAPDRILHQIGVNLLILLAILTKLTEVTGKQSYISHQSYIVAVLGIFTEP